MNQSGQFGETPDADMGSTSKLIDPDQSVVAKTPQQLAAELEPFDPPLDFDHGEEFVSEAPRQIPRFLRRGSFSRRRRGLVMVLAALGAVFVIVSPSAIIRSLSFYVLPLAYIGLAGYGLIAIAAITALRNRFSKTNFEYVISGTPFVGRVLAAGNHLTQTVNSETKQVIVRAQPIVALEYDHPETANHDFASVLGEVSWLLAQSPKYAMTISAGDYVTLVAMPGRINETLRLYGLLGLDPKRELLTYRGRPLTGTSPLTAILIAALVFCGLWLFVGFLYLINYCIPTEWSWPIGLSFMGIGGAAGAIFGWLVGWVERRNGKEASLSAVSAACGVFGVFFGVLGMGLINAVFDHSESNYQPVTVNNHWQSTHSGIFRDYKIEYTEFGKVNSEKAGISIEDLSRIGSSTLAAREVRQGALGLEWVKGFHPCEWIPVPENAGPQDRARAVSVDSRTWLLSEAQRMQLQIGKNTLAAIDRLEIKEMQLIPVLLLPDGRYASVPEAMVDRAKQQLTNRLNSAVPGLPADAATPE